MSYEDLDDEALAAGDLVGEYRIIGKVAQGGMGTVYEAMQPIIGKRVAIKVIHRKLSKIPGAIERFVQEARAVNEIGCPYIVDIFSFGKLQNGRSYLVMEWLEGRTLADLMDERPLGVSETIAILLQVVHAVQAAHDKEIIHRDLKPENVFLVHRQDQRPLVKLVDFGIAKLLGNRERRRSQPTAHGVVLGTPGYMSPEQAKGLRLTPASDIYSLGCMAFEMLCGVLPFDADCPMNVLAAKMMGSPPSAVTFRGDIAPELDVLLTQMLDRSPQRRPALSTIRGLLTEIQAETDGLSSIQDTPSAGHQRLAQALPTFDVWSSDSAHLAAALLPRRRRGLWVGGLSAAVVLGLVFAGVAALGASLTAPDITESIAAVHAGESPAPSMPAAVAAPAALAADHVRSLTATEPARKIDP